MSGRRKIIPLRQYRGVTIERQDTRGGFTGARMPWIGGGYAADTLANLKAMIREGDAPQEESHFERSKRLGARCTAALVTFGGRCLGCGFTPSEFKATLGAPRLDRDGEGAR